MILVLVITMYVKFLYESYMLSFIFVSAYNLYWKLNIYVIKLKPFTAVSFKCKNMFRTFELVKKKTTVFKASSEVPVRP